MRVKYLKFATVLALLLGTVSVARAQEQLDSDGPFIAVAQGVAPAAFELITSSGSSTGTHLTNVTLYLQRLTKNGPVTGYFTVIDLVRGTIITPVEIISGATLLISFPTGPSRIEVPFIPRIIDPVFGNKVGADGSLFLDEGIIDAPRTFGIAAYGPNFDYAFGYLATLQIVSITPIQ